MRITGPNGEFRGEVVDGEYRTLRTDPTHLLRKFKSYGISLDTLTLIRDEPYNVQVVVIQEENFKGRVWRVSRLKDWTDFALSHEFTDHRTGDEQRHLPIARMTMAMTKEGAEKTAQAMKGQKMGGNMKL